MSGRLQLISLKKKQEFKDIMSANKISTEYFTIYYQKKSSEKKNEILLSCVSAKKLGNAAYRNKLKRKLKNATREAIKDLQIKFKTNYKYAIFAKQKIYNTEFKKIVKELKFKLLEI